MLWKEFGVRKDNKMQFQIIDKTGKIIAWLDSDNDEQLVHQDYMLRQAKSGEKLEATEINGNFYPIMQYNLKL